MELKGTGFAGFVSFSEGMDADVFRPQLGFLKIIWVQMTTAKRHLLVPRHRKLPTLSNTALLGSISRWRGSRGLLKCPCPALGSKHIGCTRPGPYAALRVR